MFSSFSILKKLDWLIISAVFILTVISTLMIYSTTHQESGWHMAQKQLLFYIIGFLVMFGSSLVDYRVFRDHSWILITFYFIAIAALTGLLFFGTTIRGSRGWYNLGFFNFEPIELIKLAMVLILAKYFSTRHIEMYRIRHILISGLYLAMPVALVLEQPDFGSVIILGFIWLGIMIIAGIKWKHFATIGIVSAASCVLAWFFLFKNYQKARLLSFLNPYKDPLGAGYNIIQSKIAIGNGGLWGRGLAQGPQTQLGFLPEAHNDFIFAALSEEWGLIGAIILLSVFAFLLWRILKVCLESQNNFARLFALGYLLLIFIQVAINISTNLGLLPITGIVLPFISYGGSNLLINFIGLGILQSIIIRQKLGYHNEELNIE